MLFFLRLSYCFEKILYELEQSIIKLEFFLQCLCCFAYILWDCRQRDRCRQCTMNEWRKLIKKNVSNSFMTVILAVAWLKRISLWRCSHESTSLSFGFTWIFMCNPRRNSRLEWANASECLCVAHQNAYNFHTYFLHQKTCRFTVMKANQTMMVICVFAREFFCVGRAREAQRTHNNIAVPSDLSKAAGDRERKKKHGLKMILDDEIANEKTT